MADIDTTAAPPRQLVRRAVTAGRLVVGRLVVGRLVVGRLVVGRLVVGRLVVGRLVVGRLVVGRLGVGRLGVAVLTVGLVVGACVGQGSSAPASASPSTPASAAPSSPAAAPATASPPSQTSTEWGRIWDSLPAGFPVEPGAEPVPDPSGPASATLALPVGVPAARTWWRDALETAGYSTVGTSGPLEDGSVVIDSTGAGDCRVQVRLAPAGTGTTATILYGAACPFD